MQLRSISVTHKHIYTQTYSHVHKQQGTVTRMFLLCVYKHIYSVSVSGPLLNYCFASETEGLSASQRQVMRKIKCGPPSVCVVVRVWSLAADQADGVTGEGKIGAFGYGLSRRLLTWEGHQGLPAALTTPIIQHEHRVRLELEHTHTHESYYKTCHLWNAL